MLDVGANIGNHSLYLHDDFKKVYAFEPNPVALEKLNLHITKNSIENITVFPVGLSDVAETLAFESPTSTNLGTGRFLRADQEIPTTAKVMHLKTEIGDSVLRDQGIEDVDFIKIDVEGLEIEVMRGLQNTIHRDKPVIAFEWHGRTRSQAEFEQIREMLSGYKFFEMLEWAPEEMTMPEKLLFRLRHGYESQLAPVNQPERRTYWQLIAMANQSDLRGYDMPRSEK
jgi:FkbM family methyltransferase